MVQVRLKVLTDVLRVAEQRLEGERGEVVELLSCSLLQEPLLYGDAVLVQLLVHVKHLLLSRCQCVFEALHHTHWQYDITILMGLIHTHQLVGDSPNQVGLLLYIYSCLLL